MFLLKKNLLVCAEVNKIYLDKLIMNTHMLVVYTCTLMYSQSVISPSFNALQQGS